MATVPSEEVAESLFSGRKIIWVGCAFILAVMCISTADVIYSLRNTSVRSEALISGFRQRTHLLDGLRALMLRSALPPDAGGQLAMEASELPATHLEANNILQQLGASLNASGDEGTNQELDGLRSSIDEYWASLPELRKQNESASASTLEVQRSPERKQIRRIARRIGALNREQQDRAEGQLHSERDRLQRELLLSSLLSLAVVLALVTGMSFQMRRAERYARAQYLDVLQTRTELRNFTAKLEHAQEEERRKLSRELHDEFGQTMAAALVELSRIENELIHDKATRVQLARVKQELESSMRAIRDIALILRPSMLDDLGLVAALRWQGREVARRSGISVRIEAEDDDSDTLPDAYRTCIYRVVQEALHNIVKHAAASSAVVAFKRTGSALMLTIQDDGKGFRPSLEKGMGLLGMEERVVRLSGRVQIDSLLSRGTSIHISLPLPVQELRAGAQ